VTHLPGSPPLLGWVVIVFGVAQLIVLWREMKKYRTKAASRPGGRMARCVEGLVVSFVWLLGGALVLHPVAPAASGVMAVVAALCFPAVFVCTGLLAVLRVDVLVEWMGWPPPERRWQRGVLRGVGAAQAVSGVAMFVFLTYLAPSVLGGW
jgi:protein-S-isoprenylcysteine O-methyltransferase Ste14